MPHIRPARLKPHDTVAIVSPSWGWPSVFPAVYERGIEALESLWLRTKEYPTARASDKFLADNPAARARDINNAFADTDVRAIIASIGWDDSVRILPFLDPAVIRNNPKILMGYSDTTTLLTYCLGLGLVTFHGPSIMAGFSQMASLGDGFGRHLRSILFDGGEGYAYTPYPSYHEGYPDWSEPGNIWKVREGVPSPGWRWLQGQWRVRGQLYGGCMEVLELMKGTDFWPDKEFWRGKILFFETSELKPSVDQVRHMLRNYGVQGVFERISAMIFGRARDYSPTEKAALDDIIRDVVSREFGMASLPIVTGMDFGHTDPQMILPLGVSAELDSDGRVFRLVEPWLT